MSTSEDSKPLDMELGLHGRCDISQASPQHCYRDACCTNERYDKFKAQSSVIETFVISHRETPFRLVNKDTDAVPKCPELSIRTAGIVD